MRMKMAFHGAAGTVTGSRHLLTTGDNRILVDAGLLQGLKSLRRKNWEKPGFDPATIDHTLLTHAHIDHSGYLPRLAVMVNRIFRLMGLNGKAVLPMVLGLGCDTMATMSALGKLRRDQRNLEESERILRRTLELRTSELGSESRETLESKRELASTVEAGGKLQEAEDLYRENLEIHERLGLEWNVRFG